MVPTPNLNRFTQYTYLSSLTVKRKNDNAVHIFRLLLQFMAEQNCPFPVQGLAISPVARTHIGGATAMPVTIRSA